MRDETTFLGLLVHPSQSPLYYPWNTEFTKKNEKVQPGKRNKKHNLICPLEE